jgi:hypothetical protein
LYFIVVILIISSETAEENSSRIDEFPFFLILMQQLLQVPNRLSTDIVK